MDRMKRAIFINASIKVRFLNLGHMNLTVLHEVHMLRACKLLGRENRNAICQEHHHITNLRLHTMWPTEWQSGHVLEASLEQGIPRGNRTCPIVAQREHGELVCPRSRC